MNYYKLLSKRLPHQITLQLFERLTIYATKLTDDDVQYSIEVKDKKMEFESTRNLVSQLYKRLADFDPEKEMDWFSVIGVTIDVNGEQTQMTMRDIFNSKIKKPKIVEIDDSHETTQDVKQKSTRKRKQPVNNDVIQDDETNMGLQYGMQFLKSLDEKNIAVSYALTYTTPLIQLALNMRIHPSNHIKFIQMTLDLAKSLTKRDVSNTKEPSNVSKSKKLRNPYIQCTKRRRRSRMTTKEPVDNEDFEDDKNNGNDVDDEQIISDDNHDPLKDSEGEYCTVNKQPGRLRKLNQSDGNDDRKNKCDSQQSEIQDDVATDVTS